SSPHATSRVETTFTVDPSAKTISSPKSRSDDTVFYGIGNPLTGPYLPPKANTAEPSSSISNKTTYRNAISFDFEHSAKDPITPNLITPDLDVQASLLMIENTDAKMLSITGI